MEMEPGHLASSGNLLCPLSRTADFEHEVEDAEGSVVGFNWCWR